MSLGIHLFHNLMTYLWWSVELKNPLPDLVSSFSTTAWRVGVWVLVAAYSGALLRTGDEAGAMRELEEIVRRNPDDTVAVAARSVLEARRRNP